MVSSESGNKQVFEGFSPIHIHIMTFYFEETICMFLNLAHTKLDIFGITKQLALSCYDLTSNFPKEEKFGLVAQIRRAVLSIHFNIAEGCSRKSFGE